VTHAADVLRSAAEQLAQMENLRRARLRVAERITDLIGDTPIVRLRAFDRETPGVELWAKCEFLNPGGSVKDRAGYQMIKDAIRTQQLQPGQEIIDSTSGNTGVAYSLVGGALGYPVTLVMPGNVSWARRKITEAFGTHLVFSDPMEGSDGAILLARKIITEQPDRYFKPDQYNNEANPLAHFEWTGPEIWRQTDGRITHFLAAIGTGGTIMGTGRYLKSRNPDIRIIAVEPDDAMHGLEGLKHMASSIVPGIYLESELDDKIQVSTDDAYEMVYGLGQIEGILVGQSSGAAIVAALKLARSLRQGCVVTVFPDFGDKYLSTNLWIGWQEWRRERMQRFMDRWNVPASVIT
jgi:S-sulfo-L-cysteine synthase (O-acetyl-L-serine-dependent)